jgi:MFS family permease
VPDAAFACQWIPSEDILDGCIEAMKTVFYGWWLVSAYLVVAAVSWSLGTFGMGVYIHSLAVYRGFSIHRVSIAVTLSFMVNAATLIFIGTATVRFGPRPVFAAGGFLLALVVACIPWCKEFWQLVLLMALMGIARSCLSTTSISTGLVPWFERHQGRAISTALLGASVGGIVGTPLLLGGIAVLGFRNALLMAGIIAGLLIIPIALLVLRDKPEDLGLHPDGIPPGADIRPVVSHWTWGKAVQTFRFQTQLIAFALGMMVQVGFLSHHVSMVAPVLGEEGASLAVSCAAVSAFIGRVLLARYSDNFDVRLITSLVLIVAAISLVCMARFTGSIGLMVCSIAYGLTVGNLTTLSPIIVRREFGAASFGAVFGVASAVIAFGMALGPGLFGAIRDAYGSYSPALLLAGGLNLVAAVIIVWGRTRPLPAPAL